MRDQLAQDAKENCRTGYAAEARSILTQYYRTKGITFE